MGARHARHMPCLERKNMEKQARWAADEAVVPKRCLRNFRNQQETKATAFYSNTSHQLVFRATWAHTGELKGKVQACQIKFCRLAHRVRHRRRPVSSARALLECSRTCQTRDVQPSSQIVNCRQGWQCGKLTALPHAVACGQRRHNSGRMAAARRLELALANMSSGHLLRALLRSTVFDDSGSGISET